MKGWQALHEGKWHTIADVVDTGKPAHEEGGGNVYHLEGVDKPIHQSEIKDMKPSETKKHEDKIPGGLADKKSPKDFDPKSLKEGLKVESEHTSDKGIAQEIAMDHLTEDPKYYKKLKTVEKDDHLEVTADGKREVVAGKEPLKKDPKARWEQIKKALNNAESIMDLAEASKAPEPEEQGQPEQPEQDADQQSSQDEATQPEQEQPEQEQPEQEQPEQEQPEQEPEDQEAIEARIIEALKADGHSDAEIAYIVHGHHQPEISETDAAKAGATKAMADVDVDSAKKMSDLEHSHKQRMSDLEYKMKQSEVADPEVEKGHRKRMLDTEFEERQQKKEMAKLELEHKRRMLELEYEKAKHEASKPDPSEESKQKQMEFEMEMSRKEKELELEFKKKELALKLKITEESAKQKAEHAARQAEEDAKTNAAVKKEQAKHKVKAAKQPPKPVMGADK
jgi:hypothetical protein